MDWQLLIVIVTLIAAVAWAVVKIVRIVRGKSRGCSCCSLKDTCHKPAKTKNRTQHTEKCHATD